jgi:hypothetical protein
LSPPSLDLSSGSIVDGIESSAMQGRINPDQQDIAEMPFMISVWTFLQMILPAGACHECIHISCAGMAGKDPSFIPEQKTFRTVMSSVFIFMQS